MALCNGHFLLVAPTYVDKNDDEEAGSRLVLVPAAAVVRLYCPFRGHPNNTKYSWYLNKYKVPIDATSKMRTTGERVSYVS